MVGQVHTYSIDRICPQVKKRKGVPMKGYTLILLVMAGLLLLIPLPALQSPPSAPPVSDETPVESRPQATTPPDPVQGDDMFRILVDDTVVELGVREFLIRTLAMEMSPTYHEEALKAQAVAAYTYYSRRQKLQQKSPDPALKGADFATPDAAFPGNYTAVGLKKKWGDAYDTNYNKICRAVDAVIGKTITHNGELIDACYFALSGGSTESAAVVWGSDIPYLQAVASPGDVLAPTCESRLSFTAADFKEKLTAAHSDLTLGDDPAGWLGELTHSSAGTVTAFPVGNLTLTGGQVRTALGLRSACFTVSYDKEGFAFTVKGYGHRVGMSQYGADYLARQGYRYDEILTYYYKGVTVQ